MAYTVHDKRSSPFSERDKVIAKKISSANPRVLHAGAISFSEKKSLGFFFISAFASGVRREANLTAGYIAHV